MAQDLINTKISYCFRMFNTNFRYIKLVKVFILYVINGQTLYNSDFFQNLKSFIYFFSAMF